MPKKSTKQKPPKKKTTIPIDPVRAYRLGYRDGFRAMRKAARDTLLDILIDGPLK